MGLFTVALTTTPVTAGVTWSLIVPDDVDWLSAVKDEGSFTLTVSALSGSARSATIRVNTPYGGEKSFEVVQRVDASQS